VNGGATVPSSSICDSVAAMFASLPEHKLFEDFAQRYAIIRPMSAIVRENSNAIISAAAVIILIFGMQAAKVLLVPFLLAIFLALITVRPMLWMQQRGVPAIAGALVIVIGMMLLVAVVAAIVGSSVAEFTAALPTYQERLDVVVEKTIAFVAERINGDFSVEGLGERLDPGWAMGLVASILNGVGDVLTNVFLIFFTMIFILLEASSFPTKVSAAFGRGADEFERPRVFLDNLGRYLGIKTIVSIATGLLIGILTWIIGLDFPLLWGMLAFLLNYVPNIGSIIAAVPAILMAMLQLGPGEAMATALSFLAVNVLFGNIIEPRLMGHGVGISPLIVFIGLVFWGWVFGPVGMLLSVPLTMGLKMGLERDERTRWIALFLGSERDAEYALEQRRLGESA
jgi:predicted PurR-regulated permease PerM